MKKLSKPTLIYVGMHTVIPALLIAAVLIRKNLETLPSFFSNCWVHDVLFLYCPLCGGTRAVTAMSQLDFVEAFRYNAAVVIFAFLFLIADLVILIRLIRKKENWWVIPQWSWIAALGLFVGYTVLRNLLLVIWGIDPTGDLAVFH